MDTCTLTVTDVMIADLGRRRALHKFVTSNPKLHEEFLENIRGDIFGMPASAYCERLDDFIKRKGFTIQREEPYLEVDKENGWYRVNVIYTIAV